MDLNIPQKYFILSCNEKGSVRIFKNTRRRAYLAESSFFDLALNDIIDLTDNSVIINKVLPDDKTYLNEFFQIINKNQGRSVNHVLRAMATNEKITRIIYNEIGDSLVNKVDVTKAVTGLVFKTNNYLPNRNVKRELVTDLRKEILTSNKISPEAFALLATLYGNHDLKFYFSQFEQKQLKDKIELYQNDPTYEKLFELSKKLNRVILTLLS
ncbi:GPP34 family phosphoprotein [Companilactobacillus huachuanensis]|uniref:GPP34 family phosphoprotein n=1 Tax=Companilactobacillus huachuanensis TaxID=2559914 RepID=A0ABW1RPL9_9LACO|nr:GPP34 family phosphoprotein [Companilactobacillus huachuanensis]